MPRTPDTSRSPLEASSRSRKIAAAIILVYVAITVIPLLLIVTTALKSVPDAITYPPKLVFKPSLEGFVNLFTQRTRQSKEYLASLPPPTTWYEKIVRKRQMVIAGPSRFFHRFMNSIAIGFGSTFCSVFLGTLAAYGFSRFRIPAKDDLLFFILSTRMFPPIAAAVPESLAASDRK